jgi:hypothetical protein
MGYRGLDSRSVFNVVEGALKSFPNEAPFTPSPEMDKKIKDSLASVNDRRDHEGLPPVFYVERGDTRLMRLGSVNDMTPAGKAAYHDNRRSFRTQAERMNDAQADAWPKA